MKVEFTLAGLATIPLWLSPWLLVWEFRVGWLVCGCKKRVVEKYMYSWGNEGKSERRVFCGCKKMLHGWDFYSHPMRDIYLLLVLELFQSFIPSGGWRVGVKKKIFFLFFYISLPVQDLTEVGFPSAQDDERKKPSRRIPWHFHYHPPSPQRPPRELK